MVLRGVEPSERAAPPPGVANWPSPGENLSNCLLRGILSYIPFEPLFPACESWATKI